MSCFPLGSNVAYWHRWKREDGHELLICPDCWCEHCNQPCHKETNGGEGYHESDSNCKNVAYEMLLDGRFGKCVGQCCCYGDFHNKEFER